MIWTMMIGWTFLALAVLATGYTLHATLAVQRFARAPRPAPARAEPITLLKPLHGIEPRLAENLASFLAQNWSAPVQMVAGTNRADDPALAAARALAGDVTIRAGAPALGGNAKIANLAHMLPSARHDLLVLSDSDMAAPRDYLARVAASLAKPGVGAVTCLYHGRGDAGGWSRFAAAAITWQFMPGVAVSLALGVGHPCMGSTIALRRATLERVGGFAAFVDQLADDHAIGAAVRALGLEVVAAPGLLLAHGCVERSAAAVWRHELRWARTVRGVDGLAHLGSILTHPAPLALLAAAFRPLPGSITLAAALAARYLLATVAEHAAGECAAPRWWLPARDLFSFGVFLASFVTRSVDWRGSRLRMEGNGRVTAEP